jgi:hypothetical protein
MNLQAPFKPLVSTEERQRIFGKFIYQPRPDGSIKILGNWANENIIKVHIPQLEGVEGAPENGVIYFHRLGAAQLKALFEEWDAEGLTKYVLTWAGSFVPRMIRGSKTVLSNHAFGTAFDINAAWNPLGKEAMPANKKGTVLPLVEIAHKHGFYWGGNFTRKDGMHFEIAVVRDEPPVEAVESSDAVQHTLSASPLSQPQQAAANAQDGATQTVESGATGIQIAPNSLVPANSPIVSAPDDKPIEATTGGFKSMVTSAIGWLTGAGAGLVALLKDNQTLLIIAACLVGVAGLAYFIRQLVLDRERLRIASDPTKWNAK